MAIAFGSISTTTFAARTNTTVTAPSGIADGDVLIAIISTVVLSGSAPTVTAPAGYSAIGSVQDGTAGGADAKTYLFKKVASGESGDYTFTHANASYGSIGSILRYTGSNGVVNTFSSRGPESPANTTRTADSITTTVANCMLLYLGWDWVDNSSGETPPTGMTERLDSTTGPPYAADVIQASAGASGSKTNTCNSASGNPRGAWLVALEPASTSGAIVGTTSLTFTQTGTAAGSAAGVGSSTLTFTNSATGLPYAYGVGSSSLSFTHTGLLKGAGVLAGSETLTFSHAGTILGLTALAASSTLTFSNSGTTTGSSSLVGSNNLTFSPSGLIVGNTALVGSNTLSFTPSGVVTGATSLVGNATLTFSLSGTTGMFLSGNVNLTFTPTGTMKGSATLKGSSSLVFNQTGTLSANYPISGSAYLNFIVSGRARTLLSPYELDTGKPYLSLIYETESLNDGGLYGTSSGANPDDIYEED